ncbi:hypothetical protein LshimejAT787_0602120 [Lyophyllum shimeji]|uniref:Uncharacterized protein n=1 Tax=Lyophyllum shimeji TaxID=47721 RepID=A0A9P3PND3_LYOSH|nr:hypothetical protein LshimejAT787_0602120 [Lyophyllum shimeji]
MPSVVPGSAEVDKHAGQELSERNTTTILRKRANIKMTAEAAAEAAYKWATAGDLSVWKNDKDVYAIVNDGDSAYHSMSRYADRAAKMLQNDGDWAVLVIERDAIVEAPGKDTHRRKIKLNFQPAPFWDKPNDVILAYAYFLHDDGFAKVKKYKPDGSSYLWVLRGDAKPVGDVWQLDTPPQDRVYTIQFHAWGNIDGVYGSGGDQ